MNVAVGRLQVTITMAAPAKVEDRRPPSGTSEHHKVERAYQRERMRAAVEADRERWARTRYLSMLSHR